ncbi:YXWGXW repeat-containing protein [Usitatibacter palustris]|uniref:YXWGXW repeat-containing protein n=1 Tax=Usitatibacter palustris TaxID=2732487 RepID=A0A6M4H2J2_9PROT|nr:YXWGXW repeat-containing protein [Usitatibacter palustris]QJR13771.1 hypothetical protein DSM104440_00561 [Usitatibacter palustris]
MRKILAGLLIAGSAATMPSVASAAVDVYLNFGPPPVRYEPIPAPRRGYVWVPGYWDYRYNRHAWVQGTWVRERPGYYYAQPVWLNDGGRWHLSQGGWKQGRYRGNDYRDNDRDGIPNRADARPNDHDNDGVPDSRDRYPSNPRRG